VELLNHQHLQVNGHTFPIEITVMESN